MDDEGIDEVGVFIGGNEDKEQQGMQRQSFLAKAFMFLVVITLPLLSPFYLVALLFYQFCLVEHLNAANKAATFIVGVFLSVAWIPYANLIIYYNGVTKHCINNAVNALLPLGLFYTFCTWGVLSGIKHFSIADSYEHEQDRSHLRHLKRVELVPPIKLRDDAGGGQQTGGQYKQSSTTRMLDGEGNGGGAEITTAFDLYWMLKGTKAPYAGQAFVLACLMTIAVVTPARTFSRNGITEELIVVNNRSLPCSFTGDGINGEEGKQYLNQNSTLFILSTIQFCGIFWVFFCVLAP